MMCIWCSVITVRKQFVLKSAPAKLPFKEKIYGENG